MQFDIFGYSVTIERINKENVYNLVVNGRISRRKREKLIRDVLSVELDYGSTSHTKITAIRKTRELYGFGLVESKKFVEALFPYYQRGQNLPVFVDK